MALLDAHPTKTALGFRRSRFAPERQPLAARIVLTESDEAVFSALRRHLALPVPHLFAFSGRKSLLNFQWRLRDLYNGTKDGTYYLERPEEQFNNLNARYQPFVYSLPGDAKRGWFVHKLMGSCIRASIELNLPEDIRYIPRAEILGGKPLKIELSQEHSVVPDDLFGLDYGDGKRVFAFEDDRATEDLETIRAKRDNYTTIFKERLHQEHWGIKGFMVLFATTTEARKKALLQEFSESPFADRFLVKIFPDFGKRWRVPAVYTDVFVWESVRGPFDIRS